MSMNSLMEELRAFAREREWEQFHSASNLAKSISIEAAELLELFQWGEPDDATHLRHELADVLTYCFFLADKLGADPETVVREKLKITGEKYPVEKAKGRNTKYDRL